MDGADLRRNWRARWLSAIEEMSNGEVQRATWLNPDSGNPHYSYVEYVSCYFDDLLLAGDHGGLAARVAEGVLSQQEAAAVAPFHELFAEYEEPNGDSYDHEAILNDVAWQKVVIAAKLARQELEGLIVDPTERRHLLESHLSALQASRTAGNG